MSEPVKIAEYEVECPVCSQKALVEDYIHNVPYYGDILISVLTCDKCGFRKRDIGVLSISEPRKIIYKVEKPGDERALLIRAGGSRVLIPEFNIEISPGPFSQGFITTIEGLIMDLIEKTSFLCESRGENDSECDRVLDLLNKAKDGLVEYTVIIEDYPGRSDIVSNKTKYVRIEKEESGEKPRL
ncbi:ZPR1 zinc finger domain-containing protein [Thermosphaera chiliense]|uniref:ZPR1 zinc finger domain-containing protein n=1 Tax=Thermosphaera chiliense TaxID=3402707 RepID=A0A7M1URY3_9CREN|nr:ZPR1 zinc finger domain-containing protein [Thermosphaera aggregans]QOR94213.1 ZPR1 zinc finger domain-containing protein [Thermosphaera aggregans]